VRADRAAVGHVMFARRDTVAVMVSLTGMHAEDPKLFEKKLEPELAKLRATPDGTFETSKGDRGLT
jgi:hypothetical protein